MRLANARVLLCALVLSLAVPAAGLLAPAVFAQDAATRFAQLLAARDRTASLAGPFASELAQDAVSVASAGAGISTADFSATATFVNPTRPGTVRWDIGFAFHNAPGNAHFVVIDSEGNWYFIPDSSQIREQGAAPGFIAAPGGTNTLDLIVDGTTALLGLNGQFLTSLELPPAAAGDVRVGTGFFTGTTEPGRIIGYQDFEVWPLGPRMMLPSMPSPVPSPPVTPPVPQLTVTPPLPQPTVTPDETPTVGSADVANFAMVLAARADAEPLAGSLSGNLMEAEGQVATTFAGVRISGFHAHGVLEVPEMHSNIPWDIGFLFGESPAGTLRFVADSLGGWYFSVGGGTPLFSGSVDDLRTATGEANTIDLVVMGRRALFGVNGVLAAAIDLPDDAGPGDIAIGTGFYADQLLISRLTEYRDFAILPIAGEAPPEVTPTPPPSPADRDAFAAHLTETVQIPPDAGPFTGRLVEATAGQVALAPAGVSLTDFGAIATFINPPGPSQGLWDAGFQFRTVSDTERIRIIIDSLGDVYVDFTGQEGIHVANVPWYDRSPGGSNTLQLFVEGDRALFGVNGQFVTTIHLAPSQVASDVQIGTAFFAEDFLAGRVTDFQDFQVWEFT